MPPRVSVLQLLWYCWTPCLLLQQLLELWRLQRTLQKALITLKEITKWNILWCLYDWLTVHRSTILVDFQLDAQNSYLFTYNTFIKILYMFRALPSSSLGGLRRNCIYAASGIVTLCRWLSHAPVKRDVDLLKMSRVMLETCRGFW
jgi:hypothetical protein